MDQLLQLGGNIAIKSFSGTVVVTHDIDNSFDINLTAFLLNNSDKVNGDAGIVFYNQPEDPDGVCSMISEDVGSTRNHKIKFHLDKFPSGICKISITLTEDNNKGFSNVKNLRAVVYAGDDIISLSPGMFSNENGIVVLELYVRNEQPKVKSVWRGFTSGLEGLCKNFGVEVQEEPTNPSNNKVEEKPVEISSANEVEEKPVEISSANEVEEKNTEISSAKSGRITLNKINIDLNKKEPINLSKSGDFVEIGLKKFHVKMLWQTAVDMDLHVFYQLKNSIPKEGLAKLFSSKKYTNKGSVNFLSMGALHDIPFIQLDRDAGVGNTAGKNEENVDFRDLSVHEHILIAVNIFMQPNAKFSKYDAKVILTADGREFIIPLNSNDRGNWAVIAQIDNTGATPRLINRSEILKHKPVLEKFI